MFKCNVLQETVTPTNIEIWEKKIKTLTLNNLQKKILARYEVNSIDDYIELIKNNIGDIRSLDLYTLNKLRNNL